MQKTTFTVKHRQDGQRLFAVIAEEQNVSKKQAQGWIDEKRVLVNGKRIWIRRHLLKEDDTVEILQVASTAPIPKKISILWSDADYLIVNKAPGLLSNARVDSLEDRLQKQQNNSKICAVHRLDKETSGCLLFATSADAKTAAIPLFRGRDIIKVYRALTVGKFPNIWKEIRTDIDGYIATTLVKILDSNRQASYLELRIETGRTHQIRRHLANKRYPVLGDKKYAGTGNEISLQQPRQMLHAYRLIFPHPHTKETIRATAPIPSDIKRTLNQLKLR
ncbi:MAG: RluA family pseudouridine synthase [Pontiellaceae bacterium]